MIFIQTDETNRVIYINYKGRPVGANGFIVDNIPEPEQIEDKIPELMYDGGLYYNYVDAPADELGEETEEQIEEPSETLPPPTTEERLAALEVVMLEMVLGGVI